MTQAKRDIVERLREGGAPGSLMAKAADEIERLQAENERLVSTLRPLPGSLSHTDLCELSIMVQWHMGLHINQSGYRINEWLKPQIERAANYIQQQPTGERDE